MKEIKWPYSEENKAIFEEIEKIEDISALSKEDRMKYDGLIKVYRDNLAIAIGQRKRGFEEGYEIGLKIGIQEGVQEGIQEARQRICKKLKALGYTTEIIQQATKLSLEEIEEL